MFGGMVGEVVERLFGGVVIGVSDKVRFDRRALLSVWRVTVFVVFGKGWMRVGWLVGPCINR